MTFESWLKEKHGIDHKTFELRHKIVQEEIYIEYSERNYNENKLE